MIKTIYAIKKEMTQEFIDGRRTPVTNVVVPDHSLLATKSVESDGYVALVVGVGKSLKAAGKALSGKLTKFGIDFRPRLIRELRVDSLPEGDNRQFDLSQSLVPGSLVSVTAKSKGKGFAGVVKRFGFNTQPRTHGQSDRHRAPGSIGRGTTPGRVVPGKKMPGHMGAVNVNVKNLQVLAFDSATSMLKIKGALPGHTNSWLTIKVIKAAPAK